MGIPAAGAALALRCRLVHGQFFHPRTTTVLAQPKKQSALALKLLQASPAWRNLIKHIRFFSDVEFDSVSHSDSYTTLHASAWPITAMTRAQVGSLVSSSGRMELPVVLLAELLARF
jgi:hypothetical protein